ncbi:MAG TPA: polysaccharide deacetylase family protein [Labilithrix sp.]|nr:polysaccharide deacetylase family protein [Labilithrix sp.]
MSQLAAAVATATVIVACGSDQPGPTAEPTAVRSEALSATSFLGTSLAPKTLALTFDDGPGYGTAGISAYLAAQGVPATFFVNGAYIAATTLPNDNDIKLTPNAPALLAQLVADGHLVANHGTTHRDLTTVLATFGAPKVVQELAETDADIAAYVPSNHFLFRAPYGAYDGNVWNALALSAMNKYIGAIDWDIGGATSNYPAQAADWACWVNGLQSGGAGPKFGATPQQCGDAYLNEIGAVGRGIVLLHDSSHTDNGGTTLALVQYLVPILKAQGYTFVRVDDVPQLAALFPPVPCDASCATCSGAGASRCTSCRAGAWLSAGSCRACTVCGAGSYPAAACAAGADTRCLPCAAGSYASAGASACTTCGSCEDGDACTVDTCNAATGCTHTHVDGCAASAGPDASAAPPPRSDGDGGAPEPASDGPGGGCSLTPAPARGSSDGAIAIAAGTLAVALLRRRRLRLRAA